MLQCQGGVYVVVLVIFFLLHVLSSLNDINASSVTKSSLSSVKSKPYVIRKFRRNILTENASTFHRLAFAPSNNQGGAKAFHRPFGRKRKYLSRLYSQNENLNLGDENNRNSDEPSNENRNKIPRNQKRISDDFEKKTAASSSRKTNSKPLDSTSVLSTLSVSSSSTVNPSIDEDLKNTKKTSSPLSLSSSDSTLGKNHKKPSRIKKQVMSSNETVKNTEHENVSRGKLIRKQTKGRILSTNKNEELYSRLVSFEIDRDKIIEKPGFFKTFKRKEKVVVKSGDINEDLKKREEERWLKKREVDGRRNNLSVAMLQSMKDARQTKRWARIIELYEFMRENKIPLSAEHFYFSICAFGAHREVEKVQQLMFDLKFSGLESNSYRNLFISLKSMDFSNPDAIESVQHTKLASSVTNDKFEKDNDSPLKHRQTVKEEELDKNSDEILREDNSESSTPSFYSNFVNPFENDDYCTRQTGTPKRERDDDTLGYEPYENKFDTMYTNIDIYSIHKTSQALAKSFSELDFQNVSSIVTFIKSCAEKNRLDIALRTVTYMQNLEKNAKKYIENHIDKEPHEANLFDMEPIYLALLEVCQYSDGVDTLYTGLDMMKKHKITIKFENLPRVIFSCCAVDAADKAIEYLNLYRNQGGVPDEAIYNSVIQALGNCGLWKSFLNVLAVMKTPLPLPRILKKKKSNFDPKEEINSSISTSKKGEKSELKLSVSTSTETSKKGEGNSSTLKSKLLVNRSSEAKILEIAKSNFGVVMPSKETYDTAIKAFGSIGDWDLCLNIIDLMKADGIHPDRSTFQEILTACQKAHEFDTAFSVLTLMEDQGIPPNRDQYSVVASVAAIKKKWGKVESILSSMRKSGENAPDVDTYNLVLFPCSLNGNWSKAKELVNMMEKDAINPDKDTFTFVLQACIEGKEFGKAFAMLNAMKTEGYIPDDNIYHQMVQALSNEKMYEEAFSVCESILKEEVMMTLSNAQDILAVCAKCNNGDMAMRIFNWLKKTQKRHSEYVSQLLLEPTQNIEKENLFCAFQNKISKGANLFLRIDNSLVSPSPAINYDMIHNHDVNSNHDERTHNSNSDLNETKSDEIIRLKKKVQQLKKNADLNKKYMIPNPLPSDIYFVTMAALCNGDLLELAGNLFEEVQKLGMSNEQRMYYPLLSACSLRGQWETSLYLVEQMYKLNISIDPLMYALVMNSLRVDSKWKMSVILLEDMIKHGAEPGIINYNMVMDTCWKGGAWATTLELMKDLKSKNIEPNLESYNICLSACGRGGKYSEAMTLIREMSNRKIEPNLCSYKVVELLFDGVEKDSLHDALDEAHEIANDSPLNTVKNISNSKETNLITDNIQREESHAFGVTDEDAIPDGVNSLAADNFLNFDEHEEMLEDEDDDDFDFDYDSFEQEAAFHKNFEDYVEPETESFQLGYAITDRESSSSWNKREILNNFYNSSGIFLFPLGYGDSEDGQIIDPLNQDKKDPDTTSKPPSNGDSGDENSP